MKDYRDLFISRLWELFGDEKQSSLAERYHTSQTAISNWKNGKNFPNADTLHQIAEDYNVSIDWLLGFSNRKNQDETYDETKLTYEHAIRIFDMLLNKEIILIPDLNNFAVATAGEDQSEKKGHEEEIEEDHENDPPPEPRYDTDVLLVNDRALSYMLRRRYKLIEYGADTYEYWKEHWDVFRGIRLLDHKGNLLDALNTKAWATINKDGDWAELLKELGSMTEEERQEMIDKHTKEGEKNNG